MDLNRVNPQFRNVKSINSFKNTEKRSKLPPNYYNAGGDTLELSVPRKKRGKKTGIALLLAASILSAAGTSGCSNANGKAYANIGAPQVNLEEFSQDYYDEYINKEVEESPELKKVTDKAETTEKVPIVGHYIYANDRLPEVQSVIAQQGNEINGYIDNDTAQGVISDCWFITPVHNLSYTPKGAQILHDLISVNEDGNIDVYFKGPNLTYTVTMDEIEAGNKKYSLFSRGDDDLLVLELAAEKFRDDLKNGKIEKDANLPDYMYYTNTDGYNSMRIGETRQAYWMLAGITNGIEARTTDEIKQVLEKYNKNPEKSLLDVELKENAKVKDTDGNTHVIYASHGYGVKNMTKDTITLVCATYSHREIKLPLSELYNMPISSLVYCSID